MELDQEFKEIHAELLDELYKKGWKIAYHFDRTGDIAHEAYIITVLELQQQWQQDPNRIPLTIGWALTRFKWRVRDVIRKGGKRPIDPLMNRQIVDNPPVLPPSLLQELDSPQFFKEEFPSWLLHRDHRSLIDWLEAWIAGVEERYEALPPSREQNPELSKKIACRLGLDLKKKADRERFDTYNHRLWKKEWPLFVHVWVLCRAISRWPTHQHGRLHKELSSNKNLQRLWEHLVESCKRNPGFSLGAHYRQTRGEMERKKGDLDNLIGKLVTIKWQDLTG